MAPLAVDESGRGIRSLWPVCHRAMCMCFSLKYAGGVAHKSGWKTDGRLFHAEVGAAPETGKSRLPTVVERLYHIVSYGICDHCLSDNFGQSLHRGS